MLDNAQAPAEAPAAQEPVSAPAEANVTKGDLAAQFEAELREERGEPAEQPAAPHEAAPETETEAPEASETEEAEPDGGAETPPAVEASRDFGLSEADKAEFAKLPPNLQQFMQKRITDWQGDYTRKTQEIAGHRKTLESGAAALVEKLAHYDGILSQFTAPKLQPPDPGLRHTDPEAYDQQLAQYTHGKHLQEVAAAEQDRVRAEQQRLAAQGQADFYREQSELLRTLSPELAQAGEKGVKLRRGVFEYGHSQGYSAEQLNGATARDLATLFKAQKYDAIEKAKAAAKTVPPPAPKAAKPGPAKAIGRPTNLTSAITQLNSNPSRAALAAAYAAELASERR